MLGSTHTRIALRLSEELGITEKRNLGLIASGSTAPDSWANFPHHHGKDGEIVTNIFMARQQFLQDNDECFFRLGIALHYIADKWTLKPRIADKHTAWEIAIDKMPIVNDAELAKAVEETSIPMKEVEKCRDFIAELKNDLPRADEWKEMEISSDPVGHGIFANITNLLTESALRRYSYYSLYASAVLWHALKERPSTWSTPLLDINFAYRICLEISKEVLRKPSENMGKVLEIDRRVREFPYSYLRQTVDKDALALTVDSLLKPIGPLGDSCRRLEDVTETGDIIQYLESPEYRKISGRLFSSESSVLEIQRPGIRMSSEEVSKTIQKKVMVKELHGLLRKRLVETEKAVEEVQRKIVFRVYLPLLGLRKMTAEQELFVSCESKYHAAYIVQTLRSLARARARDWAKEYTEFGYIPSLYIRWSDFVSIPVPGEEYTKRILRKYVKDRTLCQRLMNDKSTWFMIQPFT